MIRTSWRSSASNRRVIDSCATEGFSYDPWQGYPHHPLPSPALLGKMTETFMDSVKR